MKSSSRCLFPTFLAVVIGLALFDSSFAAEKKAARSKSKEAATEAAGLGYDVFEGKTNKIARVFKADAVSVYVIYEGDKGGRNIPRSELPPGLAARYPYDADQAAALVEKQAKETAARKDRARATLQKHEQELRSQITRLEKQTSENRAEMNILQKGGKGNGRRVRHTALKDDQQAIKERILVLRKQLEQVQTQLSAP